MDCLLVSPDYNNRLNNFPWGALAIGSYLSKVKGYDVQILDASAYSQTDFFLRLAELCKKTKLVGISFMSTDSYFAKKTADYIKDLNPDMKVIVGGSHARLQPEQTCQYKSIDFVAYAEGEQTISMLLDKIKSENLKLRPVLEKMLNRKKRK